MFEVSGLKYVRRKRLVRCWSETWANSRNSSFKLLAAHTSKLSLKDIIYSASIRG